MNRKYALGLLALIGLSTFAATAAVEARPVPLSPAFEIASPVVQARYYGHGGYYRYGHHYHGGAAALGVLGGLAVGGLLAAPHYYYGPPCHIEHREVWVPGWGYEVRRVRVCY